MFKRFIFEDWVMIFPLVAFVTAASVFACFVYRAVRMRRSQAEHFAQLPFNDEKIPSHGNAAQT